MTLALPTRLTIFYAGVFGLLLTGVSLASYRALERQLDLDATSNLAELTSGMHGFLKFEAGTPTLDYDPNDPDQAAFIQEATRYYQIYDAGSGALLVQSDAIQPLGLRFTPAEVHTFRRQLREHDVQTDYGRLRLSNSLIAPGNGRSYLLQVGVRLNGMDRALSRFSEMLLWSVPAGLVTAVLAGLWMARLGLAPLSRFAGATRDIDVTNLRQRLPVRGTGDALDSVATAFNETLERLENAVGEMRQFSAALAHELRTPLAALRGEIEMSMAARPRSDEEYRRGLASQLEEVDRLKRVIDQVLTLARAEAGEIPLARAPVDLAALSASVVEQLEPVAQAREIALRCEASEPVTVEGDDGWLERLLLNLLDNAIKFTPPGGDVRLRLVRDAHVARLEVCDNGIGMRADVISHIFDRFFQADPARSSPADGVGLGLSLVKWIVARHEGRIEARSQPGKGSTFIISLPIRRLSAVG